MVVKIKDCAHPLWYVFVRLVDNDKLVEEELPIQDLPNPSLPKKKNSDHFSAEKPLWLLQYG